MNRGYALREEYIKQLKRIAIEEDRKLYEVMDEALAQYLGAGAGSRLTRPRCADTMSGPERGTRRDAQDLRPPRPWGRSLTICAASSPTGAAALLRRSTPRSSAPTGRSVNASCEKSRRERRVRPTANNCSLV